MKKVFTKIAGLSVGLALAIGVGVAVGGRSARVVKAADATVTFTMKGFGGTATGYQNSAVAGTGVDSASSSTIAASAYAFNQSSGQVRGNKTAIAASDVSGDSNKNWHLFNTAAIPGTIKSIEVKSTGSISANNYFKGKLFVALGNSSQGDVTSVTGAVSADPSKSDTSVANNDTFLFTSLNSSNSYTYFKLMSNVAFTAGTVSAVSVVVTYAAESKLDMTINEEYGHSAPYLLPYGTAGQSGLVFFAKDSSSAKLTGVTWSVSSSSILVMDDDYEDNRVWIKSGQPGEATLTATKSGYTTVSVTITVTKGEVSSLSVSGVMSKTRYAIGASWDPTGFVVTANYDTGYSADVTSEVTWEFEHDTSSTATTSVIAYATYGEITHSGYAQAVTVYEGQAYEFRNNWATYASTWGGYAAHTVSGTDLGATRNASISFSYVSKQGTTITNMPVVAAKNGTTSTMTFVLDSAVSEDYSISSVEVEFTQWGTKKVGAALYKGTSVSGEALDSFTDSSSPRILSVSNLNGDSFIVDFTTSQTGTSNYQLGVKSISVGLEEKATYGKTDHIKVTSFPRTVYHVGETYDATGLVVTAYDGADESTANYKDVTDKVNTGFVGGIYVFQDEDVPTVDMFVEYTDEELEVFAADNITFHVYATAEYELVTSAPADWSGSYLLVSSYTVEEEEHTVAINSALTNFDQPLNFVEVSVDGSTITSGQECEFTIKPYNDGYSMQGKNGKYAYGSSASRFLTSDSEQKVSFAMGEESVVTVTGATSYNLRLNTTSAGSERFGFYKDGVSNVKLYKLVESSAATQYAQTFMGAFTCDSTGENKPSFGIKEGSTKWTWALLASEYNKLSATDKELFRLGVPSSAEGASDIAKALARYDYIVGKYFVSGLDESFTDFMERNPSLVSGGAIQRFDMSEDNNTIAIVISVAAISALAFTTLLVFKKKKQK